MFSMQVVCVQMDVVWENRSANLARVRRLLADATIPPGALILLPEMFSSGFSMNVAAIREGQDRPTERFLAELARQHKAFVIGGVVTQAADERGLNEAVVFDPHGKQLARYAKLHPFSYAGETRYYRPGSRIVTFAWREMTVAPFICYDLRFPQCFRLATRRGAQLLAVIANFPTARVAHWEILLKARAIENQAYVAAVNRCGSDPNETYPGRSMIIAPQGQVLADGGQKPCLLTADVDPDHVRNYRQRFPVLNDIRNDLLP